MTSIETLKREVGEINRQLDSTLNPKRYFLVFSCGSDNEAHGVYGYRGSYIGDSKTYAFPTELEIADLKKRYGKEDNDTPLTFQEQRKKRIAGEKYFKQRFPTFESFLEDCRCKCGKHGLDNNQPYGEFHV